jgi:hypothetical protein
MAKVKELSLAEAKEVLARRHFCLVHLVPMIESPRNQHPWANYNPEPNYDCAICKREREERDEAALKEALRVGLTRPTLSEAEMSDKLL